MEEISKEPHVEDNYIENTSEDEALNFKTAQNTYMIAHQIQEKWETTYPLRYVQQSKRYGYVIFVHSTEKVLSNGLLQP